MKKQILSITATLLLASSVLFTGCKKDDTNSPVVTLKGDASMTIYVNETFTDPGATAKDTDGKDKESDVTTTIVKTGVVDNTKAGDYKITYSATDEAGNKSTDVVRTVTVKHQASNLAALYSVTESCTGVPSAPYQSNFTQGVTNLDIDISNFGDYGVVVKGKLSGATNSTVTVPSQIIAGATFSGSGSVDPDGKKVTITYSASDGVNTVNCTQTLTR